MHMGNSRWMGETQMNEQQCRLWSGSKYLAWQKLIPMKEKCNDAEDLGAVQNSGGSDEQCQSQLVMSMICSNTLVDNFMTRFKISYAGAN